MEGLLSELDEYAVEQALRIAEGRRQEAADAKDALRKALSMGADRAVHVEDDGLRAERLGVPQVTLLSEVLVAAQG